MQLLGWVAPTTQLNFLRLRSFHEILVAATETERRLPSVHKRTFKTFWPELTGERHVDYRPDETRITLCGATNKQVDAHARALEMVVEALTDPIDRKIVLGRSSISSIQGLWTQMANARPKVQRYG